VTLRNSLDIFLPYANRFYRQYRQPDYTAQCWANSQGSPASRLLSSSIQAFNRTSSMKKDAAFFFYSDKGIYVPRCV